MKTAPEMHAFHRSLGYDFRLAPDDILASAAHAQMLGRQGIISFDDADLLVNTLKNIGAELLAGKSLFLESDEDIHMALEQILTERLGDLGKKIHTARSRNDQVSTALRLYLRRQVDCIGEYLLKFRSTLLNLAEIHAETLLPGRTHLQHAQPVTVAHSLLAYDEMFDRDGERLEDGRRRMNRCPLGSGALAGTSFPIDRQWVAGQLKFDGVTENSQDGVSDRDFCIELLGAFSLLQMHLSRLAEEMILWTSPEWNFAQMDDAYATGSSMMPQKKNPDVPELIRGKTGRIYGHLMAMLTMMKALPLSYHRDMQEDKEAMFDAVDTLQNGLSIFNQWLRTLRILPDGMEKSLQNGNILATDLADYLVRKGLTFRDAYELTRRILAHAKSENKSLEMLTIKELRQFSSQIESDLASVLTLRQAVENRRCSGGPSPAVTLPQIHQKRQKISQLLRQNHERNA